MFSSLTLLVLHSLSQECIFFAFGLKQLSNKANQSIFCLLCVTVFLIVNIFVNLSVCLFCTEKFIFYLLFVCIIVNIFCLFVCLFVCLFLHYLSIYLLLWTVFYFVSTLFRIPEIIIDNFCIFSDSKVIGTYSADKILLYLYVNLNQDY